MNTSGLLVSVRSATEAEAALAGGADLIDVKEPSHGSLGRADDAVIDEVIRTVAGRRPVSAAMGDLSPASLPFAGEGLAYQKWGLGGSISQNHFHLNMGRFLPDDDLSDEDWQVNVHKAYARTALVAYADSGRANAPVPEVVCGLARGGRMRFNPCGVFVLDTFTKDGSTLLDWVPIRQIALLTSLCRQDGVRVALAGSLGPPEIAALAHLKPDWFAVRGAACRGGKREAMVDAEKVRELKALLEASARI